MSNLPAKVIQKTVKFHLDKAFQLEREYHQRKTAGCKKLQEAENELQRNLDALQKQIDGHRKQAADLTESQSV